MDNSRFDARMRALGAGTTRRGVLGMLAGLTGLGLGDVAATRRHRGGKRRGKAKGHPPTPPQRAKVTICHRTGSETRPFTFKAITVAADAVAAHEAHGDLVSCPNLQILDTASCTCVCPAAAIVCETGQHLNLETCACVSDSGTCVAEECSRQNDACTRCSCRNIGSGTGCVCGHTVCAGGQVCDPVTGCPQ